MSHCRIPESRTIRPPCEIPPSSAPDGGKPPSSVSPARYADLLGGRGTVCVPLAATAEVPAPADASVREAWNQLIQGVGPEDVRTGLTIRDPRYQDHFGLRPGLSCELIPEEEIREMWNQVVQKSGEQVQRQNGQDQGRADRAKMEKLELLLMLALNSGDMELAMLLFSSLETRQANDVSKNLLQRMQALQAQKREYSDRMAALDPNKKEDAKTAQDLNLKIGDVGTEIGMLQTFLQEATSHKNEAQQLASNFLKGRHEVGMSIARNVG